MYTYFITLGSEKKYRKKGLGITNAADEGKNTDGVLDGVKQSSAFKFSGS